MSRKSDHHYNPNRGRGGVFKIRAKCTCGWRGAEHVAANRLKATQDSCEDAAFDDWLKHLGEVDE